MAARKFAEKSLVVASHNEGKVREIRELLSNFGIETVSAADLGLPEPEETGETFRANAELKALAAATASGKPALADDSGLCVEALNGAPGIYSARWAGPQKDFDFAMERVRLGLVEEGTLNTKAWFIAGLALAWPDGHVEYFEGRVDGELVWPPRGLKGFGYDPMFVPQGFEETFGEMDPEKKHAMSHRAHAFRQLVDACFKS
jgi:XTP/dITP diphosphohydrolase